MYLETRHLACERGGRFLFRGLSLALDAGELLEIHGANGSGKSRLLRILAGITSDWSGDIRLEVSALYVGHENGLHPDLTVLQNLEWITSLCGAPKASIDQGLKAFGTRHLTHQPCHTLSVGQARRVALSRLLYDASPLWLLDEPTNSLDAKSVARFDALLANHLESGGAAVIATHTTGAHKSDLPRAEARRASPPYALIEERRRVVALGDGP